MATTRSKRTPQQIFDDAMAVLREKESAQRACKRLHHRVPEGEECALCRDQLALFADDQAV